MLPLLYLYGCAAGLIGGFVVSISVLDLTSVSYIEETLRAIAGRQFVIGLTKSIAFGALTFPRKLPNWSPRRAQRG